ncbi:MAG: hypothetical protein IJI61_10680 [Oscillospiraceae bacterium]|nr:hypothetical protein [Oscillospiraceae bacterium]
MRKSAGKAKRTGMLILCFLFAVLGILLFLRQKAVPAAQSLQPEDDPVQPSLPTEAEAFTPPGEKQSPEPALINLSAASPEVAQTPSPLLPSPTPREPVFAYEAIPDSFYRESETRGFLQEVSLEVPNLEAPEETFNRDMDIYCPYGYSEDKKYNVLILIHGGGGNCYDFTRTAHESTSGSYFAMRDLYDNMINAHLCEKLIVVSLSSASYYPALGGSWDVSFEQFASDLRTAVLPYLAEHFATFAESGDEADLASAREHFGIGGVSNGALFAVNAGMTRCFDLIGNFVVLSGNSHPHEAALAINSEDWQDLPIPCFYAGSGWEDAQQTNSIRGYQEIRNSTDRLTEGENCFYVDIAYGKHNYAAWVIQIYNALQVLF